MGEKHESAHARRNWKRPSKFFQYESTIPLKLNNETSSCVRWKMMQIQRIVRQLSQVTIYL